MALGRYYNVRWANVAPMLANASSTRPGGSATTKGDPEVVFFWLKCPGDIASLLRSSVVAGNGITL